MSSAPRFLLWPIVLLSLIVGYALRRPAPCPTIPPGSDSARLDTVYVRDTLTLWRSVRRVDTLTRDVERWKTDTVAVVTYVQLADSTIRACTAALTTCEQRVHAAQAEARAVQAAGQHALARAERDRWLWSAATMGVTLLLTRLRY